MSKQVAVLTYHALATSSDVLADPVHVGLHVQAFADGVLR